MKKIITIDGREYTMQASAFTQFKYKNDTGRKLLADLNHIVDMQKDRATSLDNLDDFLEIILQIAFVMIEEADSTQVSSFDAFLKNIKSIYEETDWMSEVIELAMSPFSGANQNSPKNIK